MEAGTILCDLENNKQFILDIIYQGFRDTPKSFNTGGIAMHNYLNLDNLVWRSESLGKFVSWYCQAAKDLCLRLDKTEYAINKLAFIDKSGIGGVGMIPCVTNINQITGTESVLVRLRTRALRGMVVGKIKEGDKVILIDDVSESGQTLHSAALRLWDKGAKVFHALTVVDKSMGAVENLRNYDIRLVSLLSFEQIRTKLSMELAEKYCIGIPHLEPKYRIFGSAY